MLKDLGKLFAEFNTRKERFGEISKKVRHRSKNNFVGPLK